MLRQRKVAGLCLTPFEILTVAAFNSRGGQAINLKLPRSDDEVTALVLIEFPSPPESLATRAAILGHRVSLLEGVWSMLFASVSPYLPPFLAVRFDPSQFEDRIFDDFRLKFNLLAHYFIDY